MRSLLLLTFLRIDSIGKFKLELWLEKPFEFWLKISYTKKMFLNGYIRHVTESENNLKPFFKPKSKP